MNREVSVVIPTIGRASVRQAVESALGQTSHPLEVIVVLDADRAPALPESSAVRVVRTSGGVGASLAKHIGIEAARGDVIALLDDDDLWRPDKLERQLAAAPAGDEWIVSSRFAVHVGERKPVVGPRTPITRHEPIAPFLFEMRTPKAYNMIPTPTLVFPIAVARTVPMSVAAGSVHDDPTWLLEVRRAFPQLPIIQLAEPLIDIFWTVDSLSRSATDRSADLIEWGLRELADESRRTRGDYLLTSPVGSALTAGSFGGVGRSIASAVRHGRPGPLAWASLGKSIAKLSRARTNTAAARLTRRR